MYSNKDIFIEETTLNNNVELVDISVNNPVNYMDEHLYLTDMPDHFSDYGLSKVLNVRHEVIHIKHIMTEVFVRKTIDIQKYLDKLNITLFDYITILTNRLRHIHKFTRQYTMNVNNVVKDKRNSFFRTLELLKGHNICIVLDFDGVVTSSKFKQLYELCCQRCRVEICSANPTITPEWFDKRGYTVSKNIE